MANAFDAEAGGVHRLLHPDGQRDGSRAPGRLQGEAREHHALIGAENLTKLDAQIQARQKELASTRIADATEVLEYLTSVMRREKTETVVVTLSEEQTDFVPGPDGKLHKRTVKRETPKIVEIPARLADANKAAELIGKRLMLWTERTQVGLELPVFLGEDELAD